MLLDTLGFQCVRGASAESSGFNSRGVPVINTPGVMQHLLPIALLASEDALLQTFPSA